MFLIQSIVPTSPSFSVTFDVKLFFFPQLIKVKIIFITMFSGLAFVPDGAGLWSWDSVGRVEM